MKWPEASTGAGDIQWLADAGFEMTSIYHFIGRRRKGGYPSQVQFRSRCRCVQTVLGQEKRNGDYPVPAEPVNRLGRPSLERPLLDRGRTPDKFAEICRQFKQFSKESESNGRCSRRSMNGAKVLTPSPAANSDSECTKPFATTSAKNRIRLAAKLRPQRRRIGTLRIYRRREILRAGGFYPFH